ncbi:hypothetical protein ACFL0X_02740 [Nanoarchaeota archaeon]
MNKWAELLIGLILLNGAVLVWYFSLNWSSFWNFGTAAWEVLKGGLVWIVILVGLLFIMLGISDLKD